MFTAHQVLHCEGTLPHELCIDNSASEAILMYEIVNTHGRIIDPEPITVRENGHTIGVAIFGPWTAEGREVFFSFPKRFKKQIKMSLDLPIG